MKQLHYRVPFKTYSPDALLRLAPPEFRNLRVTALNVFGDYLPFEAPMMEKWLRFEQRIPFLKRWGRFLIMTGEK